MHIYCPGARADTLSALLDGLAIGVDGLVLFGPPWTNRRAARECRDVRQVQSRQLD